MNFLKRIAQHKRKLLSTILTLAIVMALTGFSCHHAALQTSLGVAASLKAMQDAEINLHTVGKLDDSEHRLLQQGFRLLAQSDKDVRQCIYASGAPTCVDIGINAAQRLLASPTVVGIKNPDSQQQLQLAGQSLITSLSILKGAL